jgi:phosphate acetyltransferase
LKSIKTENKIIFPEGEDERILHAAKIIIEKKLAIPILVGDRDKIKWRQGELGYESEIRDPNKEDTEELAMLLYDIRKEKGMTKEKARELVKDTGYFSTLLLKRGDVDGLVSGATHTTADTLRPALQIIKTEEGVKTASSFFIIIEEGKLYFFADCGFNIKPNPEQLADIAWSTAESARFFDIEPKVAFLSFSTKGSAEHEDVKKVHDAVEILKKKNPDFDFDGEIQVDAAIVPEIAERKAPHSKIKGDANVLIFPDLNSGNIAYKLVERLGGATAIGPIVQGLKKPVNDLSRGCSIEDVVGVTAITCRQIEGNEED